MAAKAEKTGLTPRISDEAVRAKTGKTWKEWFALLDKAEAKKMSHPEIAACVSIFACVSRAGGIGPWWRQMVAVSYEQARGLREKHEKPSGYEISVSRTIAAPVNAVYRAWVDDKVRAKWLPEKSITIRRSTENKSVRITWSDGKTSLEVRLYPKGERKCQVTAQHSKLSDATAAEKMKNYWAKALDQLKQMIEK